MASRDPRRDPAYKRQRKAYMDANPICEWCNRNNSQDLHHCIPLAIGGDLMDKGNWMALCKPCHRHLNQNPMLTIFGAR